MMVFIEHTRSGRLIGYILNIIRPYDDRNLGYRSIDHYWGHTQIALPFALMS